MVCGRPRTHFGCVGHTAVGQGPWEGLGGGQAPGLIFCLCLFLVDDLDLTALNSVSPSVKWACWLRFPQEDVVRIK